MSLAKVPYNRDESRKKGTKVENITSNILKLYVFYCSNSSNSDEFDSLLSEGDGTDYKLISLPCSGKANVLYFLKAFETGADGLVVITCSKNECRYLEGNLRAPKRANKIDFLLEEAGMGQGRIAVLPRNGNGTGGLISKITEFRDKIRMMASPASS
jgi:coenzyme F420-reducing hydrogenase delta subunit